MKEGPDGLPLKRSVRGHPGPGFALGDRDLDLGHHLGDLTAKLDRVGAAFQGSKIEPFMRGDEIDHAGTPARPVQTALEQHVGNSASSTGVAASRSMCP